jgi:hypothetical protein
MVIISPKEILNLLGCTLGLWPLLIAKAGVLVISEILIFTILSAKKSKVLKGSIVLLKSKLAAVKVDSGN